VDDIENDLLTSYTPLNINYEKKLQPNTNNIKTMQGLESKKKKTVLSDQNHDENIEIETDELIKKKVNCIESFKVQVES
jgi:hypothetical protein